MRGNGAPKILVLGLSLLAVVGLVMMGTFAMLLSNRFLASRLHKSMLARRKVP